MLSNLLSGGEGTSVPASQVHRGDWLLVRSIPYARPTNLHIGWHRVLEVIRHRSPKDVVSFRVLPADMTERNDVLPFNVDDVVRIRRVSAQKLSGVVYSPTSE